MEFWESAFKDKQEMWGMSPANSAILARDLFIEKEIKDILIPGIGYGRNAKIFLEAGISVTGIEISQTAIDLANKHFGNKLTIHHGSVTQMPFETKKYDGIFCYALIHLLDELERKKLIQDCFNQLSKNGYMIFTAITKEAPNFGQGKQLGKDRFEFHKGAKIFYYDQESVKIEFEHYGLYEITEVDENQPMYSIMCKKK
ncbi:bifunctional 2-polyprenyl-6-hydroxyphenol methylase/3-demethylubiquinol 3-O-methyltransferase UbiG [Flavobacterium sp. J27]|uniref:class I SAM-dependent methyltransferase n=1 Tax=Flavobacterium sp. J27 TaxID=2060419 RepID=UPI0010326812|nr:class I SAM-dependent methyltransferase [Flavobacterium sp. J27]